MRKEILETQAPQGSCDGVETNLFETERRYRSAKGVLLDADGASSWAEASEEFVSARAALRLVLEEIWPDRERRYGN